MKPSDRIKELCRKICASRGRHQPSTKDLSDALPYAIVELLDEEWAKDQATIAELAKKHPEAVAPFKSEP